MTNTRSVVKSEHIESGKSNLVPHKTLSDAELETLYTALCNGMETLHQQSEAQMGRARILFYALSAFLMERGIVDDMAATVSWGQEHGAPEFGEPELIGSRS